MDGWIARLIGRWISLAGVGAAVLLLAAGCARLPPYEVDTVEEPPSVAMGADTGLVYLEEVRLIDDPAQPVGISERTAASTWLITERSLGCFRKSTLTWEQLGRIIIDPSTLQERLEATFHREMEHAGVNVAADLQSPFRNAADLRPEIVVRATLAELRAKICWPEPGPRDRAYGKVWMQVRWDISPGAAGDVRALRSVGGAGESERTVQPRDLLDRAFAQATRRLLADERFAELIRKPSDPSAAGR